MYFWNTRQLAQDLREGSVTERQQMWYFFAYAVSTSVYVLVSEWIPSEYNLSKIGDIASLGVTIIGVLACYQVNSRGDDKQFVVRFICISWPVLWRLLAVAVPLGLLASVPVVFVAPQYADPFADGLAVLLEAAYFVLIGRWLMKISSTE